MRCSIEYRLLTFMIDISPQNVLVEIEDDSSLKDLEEQKTRDPSTPVISEGAPVYRSREPLFELSGVPILTDFGQMRISRPVNQDWWMSDMYRAPEVLLQLPWCFPVDIWSIGIMVIERLPIIRLY